MKILINKITDILNDKLSLTQRGILITILLCKDDDERITLAKSKIFIKMNNNEVKRDLIYLHRNKYIKWSGYTKAIMTLKKKKEKPEVKAAIKYMNDLYGRRFDAESKGTISELSARLEDGEKLETIKLVIANRYLNWKDSETMKVHLNPGTIFKANKYPKYKEEALRTKEGEGLLDVEKVNMKEGTIMTTTLCEDFNNRDIYHFTKFKLNTKGARMGIGLKDKTTGKNLKLALKSQDNIELLGNPREYEYTYLKK